VITNPKPLIDISPTLSKLPRKSTTHLQNPRGYIITYRSSIVIVD